MHTVVWCGWQVGFRLDSVTTQEYISKWRIPYVEGIKLRLEASTRRMKKRSQKVTLRCDHVWGHRNHLSDEEISQNKKV